MDVRGVRRVCEAQLNELDLPQPFVLKDFCFALARQRGKPIRLVAMPDGPGAPCGIWLATDHVDWIVHQSATSRLHEEHIILHELAHMIFGHAAQGQPEGLGAVLLPDIDPRTVASVLARTSYTSRQECEAEMLAGLIGTRARRPGMPTSNDAGFTRTADLFGVGT